MCQIYVCFEILKVETEWSEVEKINCRLTFSKRNSKKNVEKHLKGYGFIFFKNLRKGGKKEIWISSY